MKMDQAWKHELAAKFYRLGLGIDTIATTVASIMSDASLLPETSGGIGHTLCDDERLTRIDEVRRCAYERVDRLIIAALVREHTRISIESRTPATPPVIKCWSGSIPAATSFTGSPPARST